MSDRLIRAIKNTLIHCKQINHRPYIVIYVHFLVYMHDNVQLWNNMFIVEYYNIMSLIINIL